MAVLPGPDAVGPVPDNLPRRMGVGQWNPRIISEDTQQAGQGLERLGTGIADLDAAQTQQNNQLQQAQARAAVISQTTATLAKLPSITNPDDLAAAQQSIGDTVDQAASTFKDPRQAELFQADITPHVAETYGHIGARAREITNNSNIAGFEQNATNTLNSAVTIDDDNMSMAALKGVSDQIDPLVATGALTPTQAFQRKVQLSQDYVRGRYSYLEQQAYATGDTSRLQNFITTQQGTFNGAPGSPGQINPAIPPEGRALLATIYGPESGANYNARYSPTGGATFAGFADHPRIKETIPEGQPNAGLTSDAAGAPQFLSSTWDMEAKKLGLKDFSPPNQDAAAWDLAQTTYKQQTGRDLLSDLQSHNPGVIAGVAGALKGQWSSLPAGVQPGTTVDKFTSQYLSNLQAQTARAPAFVGQPPAPALAPQPVTSQNAYFIGDSIADGLRKAAAAQGDTAPLPSDPPRDQWPPGTAYLAHSATGAPIYVGSDGTPLSDRMQPSLEAAQAAAAGAPGPTPPLAPPQSRWPAGTAGIAQNPDGTMSYVGQDGTRAPVPGSRATGTPFAGVPPRPTGTILDALPVQEHAEIIMRAQTAIDAVERRNAAGANLATKQALTEMSGISTALVQGLPVSDQAWDSYRKAYSNSPDPNVRLAFAQTDAIRANITKFQGMPPAAVQAAIDNMRQDYASSFANDPSSPNVYVKGQVLSAAQAYFKQLQADLKTNPLGRASSDGVIPGGIQPVTDAASMQKRVAQAQAAADHYGVPAQYFAPQERNALKSVAAAGGDPMVNMASAIVAGAGSAAPDVFKEIGGSAPAFQRIGLLAMDKTADHSDTINDIASYIHAMNDPQAKKDLPRFSEGFMKKQLVDDPLGNAYVGFGPDETARLREQANIVLGARASAEGTDPKIDPTAGSLKDQKFYNKAYSDVLGASYGPDGAQYGGIAKVGGNSWNGWGGTQEKTVIPPDMKADDFHKVVGSITDNDLKALPNPPYEAGGTPVTAAEMRQGQLVARPDRDGVFRGAYTVTMPDPNGGLGRDLMRQDGKAFVLYLADPTLHDTLSRRYPDSFLAAPAKSATPAPSPYRNIPGMVSAEANEPVSPVIPQGD